ncbi:hypothetical protein POVWA2_021490 [Plasmodium ovale wallikeri]|uniref:Uncharacterized protein n=2 Tax=Plasmodium ovale TaxID=36330 RepID=A0A1A8YSX3_PLAOA|nr:hypothetical protein POVWA1_021510 [Plasmodium ovale wallikeri]SBT34740.1 hypothetical protein POVWA2_021490 [Plasmodium ovale wallikeri]SBT76764.1 hypothetical protein POWCR01_080025900 [Plasmodium ovale]
MGCGKTSFGDFIPILKFESILNMIKKKRLEKRAFGKPHVGSYSGASSEQAEKLDKFDTNLEGTRLTYWRKFDVIDGEGNKKGNENAHIPYRKRKEK